MPYHNKKRGTKARERRGKPGVGSIHEPTAVPHLSELDTQARKLKRLGRRLVRKAGCLG